MSGAAILRGAGLALLATCLTLPLAAQQPAAPRPLSLDAALELAIPASDAVGLARAEIRRADGEVKRVTADLLPQLTGTASYSRALKSQFNTGGGAVDSTATTSCSRFTPVPSNPLQERVDSLEQVVSCFSALNPFAALGNLPFGRKNTYNFGLAFSQTLFNSSLMKGRPRAATAGRQLARLGVTTAEAQARLDVIQAYFDAVLSDRLVAIAELSLAQADTTLAQARLGKQVGTQSEFELLRAQVTRDNQRATVLQRRSQRNISYLQLHQLLGIPQDQAVVLTTGLDETPAGGVEDSVEIAAADTAVEGRAAISQADQAVVIQEILTNVTRWDRLPSVTLSSKFARIGYPDDGVPWNADFVSDWTVGVNVSVPLWTSGRLTGNTWIAEANLEQARIRAAQAREAAALDGRAAVERLQSARATWAATQGTVQQAERAYQIATLRYREGISTQVELTDARLLLEQAQANRATAARDVEVATSRLRLLRDLPIAGTDIAQTLSSAASGQQALQQPAPAPATTTGF